MLKRVCDFTLGAPNPYNFELTVHKPAGWYWFTPFEAFERGTIWTAARLSSDDVVGLKASSLGSVEKPEVLVQVFCEDRLSNALEKETLEIIREATGVEEDVKEFYLLAGRYPVLEQAVKDLYGMRASEDPEVFHKVILSITLQMTRIERSYKMLRLLLQNYGRTIVFDDHSIRMWPSAKTLSQVEEDELREKCNLGYRATWIKKAAEDLCEGEIPSWMELKKMSREEAKKALMRIRGVGEYSADIITPHPGFPVDVWSVKIFYTLLFGRELEGNPRSGIPVVREYAEKEWGKWQGYAFTYVLNDLKSLSRELQINVGDTLDEKP